MSQNNTTVKNILSLTFAELINKSFMYIYTAYLARKIGVDGFGSISFAQSVVSFFLLLVSFGIDNFGIRYISQNRDKAKEFIDNTLSFKIFLCIITYILLIIFVLFLNKEYYVKIVILLIGLNIIATGMLLNWVFIGLEKFYAISIRLVFTSLLTLIGIFIFVHNQNDTILTSLIISGAALFNTFIMILYYHNNIYKINLNLNFAAWKSLFISAIPLGLFNLFVVAYSNIGPIMVGLLRKSTYLFESGILNSSNKVILLCIVPSAIFQQSFFPQLSRCESLDEKKSVMKKYTNLSYLTGCFFAISTFVYSDFVITKIWGDKFIQGSLVLKISSITLLLVYLNVSLSPTLIAWGKEKAVLKAVFGGLIVNIIVNSCLVYYYGMYGSIISMIFTELTVYIGLTVIIYKILNRTYFFGFLKILIIGICSFIPSYLLLNKINIFSNICISTCLFGLSMIVFKIIDFNLIKNLFIKSEVS